MFSSQPFSAGFISGLSLFCVSFFRALFMPGSRFFAVSAGMVRGINMIPAVVPISSVGWIWAGIFVNIGQGGSEFGNILECFD